jgi:aldose 1-epimerase
MRTVKGSRTTHTTTVQRTMEHLRIWAAAIGCLAGAASCQNTAADNNKAGNANNAGGAAGQREGKGQMAQKSDFGKDKDGHEVEAYTLTNAHGMTAKVITYGATLTELHVPGKDGKTTDVVLGFNSMSDHDGYLDPKDPYFGATVGRYGNRIAKGKFTLDGHEYTLATNNGPNALHGGNKGFDKVIWKAEPVAGDGGQAVRFTYSSADMEEGYPGNLKASVTYTLTDKDELVLDYSATTDKDTVVNLTNHSYFNLAGEGNGTVLENVVLLESDKYLPVDDTLIPTGELKDVKGTPFDFTTPKPIGRDIKQVPGEPNGYDHCFVIRGDPGQLRRFARVTEPKSGRVMEMYSTEPAVQFYTGNFLDGTVKGKSGKPYVNHGALCLEAEHYPDSPNRKEFPSTELKPGQTYKQTTMYKFGNE